MLFIKRKSALFFLKILLLTSLFSLFIACNVGPSYHPPLIRLPARYLPMHAIVKTHQPIPKECLKARLFWWRSFNDPVLAYLIERALVGSNLDMQKARAKICEARARLGIARADFYPQLNMNGKISRKHLSRNGEFFAPFPNLAGIDPKLDFTDYQVGFDASWELDFFGYTRHSVNAAKARLQSAIENQHDVSVIVAAEIAKIYTQYRLYQQRIRIARHTISSYLETVRLVKLRVQSGSANSIDLKRVESETLSAKASLFSLQAEERATLAALAVIVGEYPETLFMQLKKSRPIPVMKPGMISLGLPSDLLINRPDIRRAERELAATTAEVGMAIANQFPRFSLVGNLGIETVHPGTFFDVASRYWSFGPKFYLPIFQGGRLKYTILEREAIRNAAFAAYKLSILQALSEVESAIIRYDYERQRKYKLGAAYKKLLSTTSLLNTQYQAGQISLTEVLDIERQRDEMKDQYAQSIGQVTIHLVALYKALGGGWEI